MKPGIGSEQYAPMAQAIIGGLTSSVFIDDFHGSGSLRAGLRQAEAGRASAGRAAPGDDVNAYRTYLRGEFRQFSVERLLRFLVKLDQDVEIVVRPHSDRQNAPALHVS
jgi:hypothetical protein